LFLFANPDIFVSASPIDIYMKRGSLHSLLLALALVLQACAWDATIAAPKSAPPPKCGETEPIREAPQEQPFFLRGFSLLEEEQEPAVGYLSTADGRMVGSAVLISPRVAITAAHCVLAGYNLTHFTAGGIPHEVRFTAVHPQCSFGGVWMLDIALVFLYEDSCIAPMPLAPAGYQYTQRESLTAIGYGGGVKKRSNPDTLWYYGTLVEEPWVFKMLPLDGTVWFGDSGGAIVNAKGELVGVVSSLGIYRGNLYENSAVRLDLIHKWITETQEAVCN
jgi:hypothetical protein